MRNKVLATFCMNFSSEFEDELFISLALYADKKGADWVQIRANVCSRSGRIVWLLRGSAWRGWWLQLRVRELSLRALRHTGGPQLSKSFKTAQPGTSEQSYGDVIMCLGLCKCLSVLLDMCPNLSVSFYPVFKPVVTIPASGRKIIYLVMTAEKRRSVNTKENNSKVGETGKCGE